MKAKQLCLLILSFAFNSAFAAEVKNQVKVTDVNGIVNVSLSGSKILEYKYKDVPFKPYVAKLFTPGGVNILLDSPDDHKHHHGLMFAWNVNGVNFWEETENCGVQKQQSILIPKGESSEKKGQAKFSTILEWIDRTNQKMLLMESRTIEAESDVQQNATIVTWKSVFSVPKDINSVTISGAHYHGLGMRFLRSMDANGEFLTSSGKAGEVFRGDERLVESSWCAYVAQADGRTVTVAMFDHPLNVRPATYFIMKTPFAYLSATMRLHEKPIELKAKDSLTVQYGIAVWDGKKDRSEIEKTYQEWLKNHTK
jgi:hypothetical protein